MQTPIASQTVSPKLNGFSSSIANQHIELLSEDEILVINKTNEDELVSQLEIKNTRVCETRDNFNKEEDFSILDQRNETVSKIIADRDDGDSLRNQSVGSCESSLADSVKTSSERDDFSNNLETNNDLEPLSLVLDDPRFLSETQNNLDDDFYDYGSTNDSIGTDNPVTKNDITDSNEPMFKESFDNMGEMPEIICPQEGLKENDENDDDFSQFVTPDEEPVKQIECEDQPKPRLSPLCSPESNTDSCTDEVERKSEEEFDFRNFETVSEKKSKELKDDHLSASLNNTESETNVLESRQSSISVHDSEIPVKNRHSFDEVSTFAMHLHFENRISQGEEKEEGRDESLRNVDEQRSLERVEDAFSPDLAMEEVQKAQGMKFHTELISDAQVDDDFGDFDDFADFSSAPISAAGITDSQRGLEELKQIEDNDFEDFGDFDNFGEFESSSATPKTTDICFRESIIRIENKNVS